MTQPDRNILMLLVHTMTVAAQRKEEFAGYLDECGRYSEATCHRAYAEGVRWACDNLTETLEPAYKPPDPGPVRIRPNRVMGWKSVDE